MPGGRTARDPLKAIEQPNPLCLMPRFNDHRLNFRPILLKIFAENLTLRIVEIRNEQAVQLAGAVLKHGITRRVECSDRCFEHMHVRILSARHGCGNPFKEATMRRSQVAVEKPEQGVNLVPNLSITAQLIDSRQRKQHECVVIGIARRFHDRSARIEQMYKSQPSLDHSGRECSIKRDFRTSTISRCSNPAVCGTRSTPVIPAFQALPTLLQGE